MWRDELTVPMREALVHLLEQPGHDGYLSNETPCRPGPCLGLRDRDLATIVESVIDERRRYRVKLTGPGIEKAKQFKAEATNVVSLAEWRRNAG